MDTKESPSGGSPSGGSLDGESLDGESPDVKSPDGGWGWMVVLGAALINMVNQALFSIFGLVFGEELEYMANGKAVGLTLVLSVNVMVSNFTGLAVGPLMKKMDIRTLTIIGIFCTGSGMLLSSFAKTIFQITIFYGCLTGLGLGLLASVTFLAINSYFTQRKSTAVGLAMAGTSVGQMVMPIFVGMLLENYQYHGATLVLGLLSYTGIFGAILFKPISCCIRKKTTSVVSNNSLLENKQIIYGRNDKIVQNNNNCDVDDKRNLYLSIRTSELCEEVNEDVGKNDVNSSDLDLNKNLDKKFYDHEKNQNNYNQLKSSDEFIKKDDRMNIDPSEGFSKDKVTNNQNTINISVTHIDESEFIKDKNLKDLNPFESSDDLSNIEDYRKSVLSYDSNLDPFNLKNVKYCPSLNPFENSDSVSEHIINTEDNVNLTISRESLNPFRDDNLEVSETKDEINVTLSRETLNSFKNSTLDIVENKKSTHLNLFTDNEVDDEIESQTEKNRLLQENSVAHKNGSHAPMVIEKQHNKQLNYNEVSKASSNEDAQPKGCLTIITETLGLHLLKDMSFVHLLLGLALGYTGTVTFSAFYPVFLQDEVKFNVKQTSFCMAVLSLADILGRTTISEITRRLHLGSKSSFMVGAILLGLSRSWLVELNEYKYVLIASFVVGYFRAATVINQNLVISEYVENEKLPSAIGLNMVTKGVFVISLGQLLGLLKDAFSYRICIHLLNVILFTVVVSWSLEMIIRKKFSRNKNNT